MDDGMLRERYQKLLERGGSATGASAVPLETIEALAEGRLEGSARMAALDRVLADPAARTEFEFLRELAKQQPAPAAPNRRWLIAAGLLVAVGGGLLWRVSSTGPEPLRGPDSAVTLVGPGEGESLTTGGRLIWRPVNGAVGYVVEVLTPDGEVAFRAETTDTTAVLAAPAAGAVHTGPAQWFVVAKLGGASELRSVTRQVVLGR